MEPDEIVRDTRWLRRFALELVGDPDEADDVVQETWLAALSGGPLRADGRRSWLRRVARNFAYGRFRRRARRERREQIAAVPESVAGPEEHVQRLETLRDLAVQILELDEAQRSLILLRFFAGLNATEIGSRLDLKPSAVRMRLKRALETLRARLDVDHDGERRRWQKSLLVLALGRRASGNSLAPPPGSAIGRLAVAAALCLGVVLGTLAGPARPGPRESRQEPPPVCRELERRLGEIDGALHDARSLLAARLATMDELEVRLALLEERLAKILRAAPA